MPVVAKPGVSIHKKSKVQKGFTMMSPLAHHSAYLLDMEGKPVHRWKLKSGESNYAYMLPNGNLFANERSHDGPQLWAGKGGIMREYDWKGKLVWEHIDENQHHDARRLPNGNCIYIAWKPLTRAQAKRVKGGVPKSEGKNGMILGDVIREVNPEGEVVWEWFTGDLDIEKHPIGPLAPRHEFAHANTVAPMANGDVMVSFRVTNTIIIIDKKTRKVKWKMRDESWGGQHDCHQLDNKNIMLFANGNYAPARHPSARVIEFKPKTGKVVWEYSARRALDFLSPHISGAQRLPNGNTLICEGAFGRIFEVTHDGDIVWEYTNPHEAHHPVLGYMNWVFRAYRYAPKSLEIQGRLS